MSFFYKKSLLELEVVYSDKYYKVFTLKMEKESPKDANHLQNDKNSSYSKRYKKDIEKEGGVVMKN